MQRNWTTKGAEETFNRSQIEAAINSMDWQEIPKGGTLSAPMMPGEGIKAAIRELKIPKVSHVAWSRELSPYGFYGIRGHYLNGVAEVYIADMGTYLVTLVSDFHPKQKAGE